MDKKDDELSFKKELINDSSSDIIEPKSPSYFLKTNYEQFNENLEIY